MAVYIHVKRKYMGETGVYGRRFANEGGEIATFSGTAAGYTREIADYTRESAVRTRVQQDYSGGVDDCIRRGRVCSGENLKRGNERPD